MSISWWCLSVFFSSEEHSSRNIESEWKPKWEMRNAINSSQPTSSDVMSTWREKNVRANGKRSGAIKYPLNQRLNEKAVKQPHGKNSVNQRCQEAERTNKENTSNTNNRTGDTTSQRSWEPVLVHTSPPPVHTHRHTAPHSSTQTPTRWM